MAAESSAKGAGVVAILVADGFEQVELTMPKEALEAAGFTTEIVSPVPGTHVQGFHHAEKGDAFSVDVKLSQARPERYAALFLPGGVHNPDALRLEPQAIEFVRHFFTQGKPVAAICHGPWTLIDADVVAGRKLTSWPSIKRDLLNAGAEWTDAVVVVDQGLVTSRKPDDLPQFCTKMIEEFREGSHGGAQRSICIAKLGEMIKDIKVAMLTTVLPDGTLHSRPMATLHRRFDGTLWFFTGLNASQVNEVEEHRQVCLNYSDPQTNRYVAVSGRAKLVLDREKAAELYTPMVRLWFPKGLDDPDLGLLRVEVDRAEYWDSPSRGASEILAMARSLLTGRPLPADAAQHDTLTLGKESGQGARP
jgi:protease I